MVAQRHAIQSTMPKVWDFNMPEKAIECLESIIEKNPAKTEAHFRLGKYCLLSGRMSCAEERFEASPVREKYGKEIANLYWSVAEKELANNERNSLNFFQKINKNK